MKIVQIGERKSCQLCDLHFGADRDADYDGKTVNGPWAFMCASCHSQYGVGIGVGKGQRISWRGKMEKMSERVALSKEELALILDAIDSWLMNYDETSTNPRVAEMQAIYDRLDRIKYEM